MAETTGVLTKSDMDEIQGAARKAINRSRFMHCPCSAGAFMQIVVVLAALILVYGCASPDPAPSYAPAPSTFDRAWSAALNAAQDEGVRISAEDRVSGTISGSRGEQEITIFVRTQADGNVRLEFSVRGPKGADPGLAGRISRAYDRRMGR